MRLKLTKEDGEIHWSKEYEFIMLKGRDLYGYDTVSRCWRALGHYTLCEGLNSWLIYDTSNSDPYYYQIEIVER